MRPDQPVKPVRRVVRMMLAILTVLTATAAVTVIAAAPAAAQVYSGAGRQLVNQSQGLCLTYPRWAFDNHQGGQLVVDYCRGLTNQKWYYRPNRLLQSENGDCVELESIGASFGRVVASRCDPGNLWETWYVGSNWYGTSVYAHNSFGHAKCLSSSDGGAPGTGILFNECNVDSRAQGFIGDQAQPFRYVALGDSYQAGNGADNYVDWTCYNSWNGYSVRLNGSLSAQGKTTYPKVQGVACSGATTSNYWFSQDKGNGYVRAAQRGHLSHSFGGNGGGYGAWFNPSEVGLVTIGMGGNDIGFADFLRECLNPVAGDCATPQRRQQMMDAVQAVRPQLRDIYRDIAATNPNARIRVVNYPLPLERDLWGCLPQLSDAEYWLQVDVHRELNNAIAWEVFNVREEVGDRLRLVDIVPRFVHHGVCGNGGYWINPINPNDMEGSVHPNYTGHGEIANAVADSL